MVFLRSDGAEGIFYTIASDPCIGPHGPYPGADMLLEILRKYEKYLIQSLMALMAAYWRSLSVTVIRGFVVAMVALLRAL